MQIMCWAVLFSLIFCHLVQCFQQEDSLDVLGAFNSLVRTVKEVNKLSSKQLDCGKHIA